MSQLGRLNGVLFYRLRQRFRMLDSAQRNLASGLLDKLAMAGVEAADLRADALLDFLRDLEAVGVRFEFPEEMLLGPPSRRVGTHETWR